MKVIASTFRLIALAGALFAIGVIKLVYGLFARRWHREITVIVETPEGEIRRSTVHAISFAKSIGFLQTLDSPSTKFRGEPLAIELGTRVLVVGVAGSHSYPSLAMNKAKILTRSTEGAAAQLKSEGRPMSMLLKRYPPWRRSMTSATPRRCARSIRKHSKAFLVRDTV